MDHADTLRAAMHLVDHLMQSEQLAEAGDLSKKVVIARHMLCGGDHEDTMQAAFVHVQCMMQQHKYREAENMLNVVVGVRKQKLGMDHADTRVAHQMLVECLMAQKQYAKAEGILRAMFEAVCDCTDGFQVADELSWCLLLQQKYAEAEHILYRRGMTHDCIAPALPSRPLSLTDALVERLLDEHKYAQAKVILDCLVHVNRQRLGRDHPDTRASTLEFARVLSLAGEKEDAVRMQRCVLATDRRRLGDDDPETLATESLLAQYLFEQGALEQAADTHRRVLAARERVLNDGYAETWCSMVDLGECLRALGRYQEEEAVLRRLWAAYKRECGEWDEDTLLVGEKVALCLARQEDYARAEQVALDVMLKRQAALSAGHVQTQRAAELFRVYSERFRAVSSKN